MTAAASQKRASLPPPTRRGLDRVEAAAYVGVSPNTFDRMVADGLMPKPAQIYGRKVWDCRRLDSCFDTLQGTPSASHLPSWD